MRALVEQLRGSPARLGTVRLVCVDGPAGSGKTTFAGRLAELLAAVRLHPHSTPWELAAFLTWSRPWAEYERRMRIFAVTETDAHLRLLASRGLVTDSGGPVPTWTLAVR